MERFHPQHDATPLSNIVNKEKGHKGKKHVFAPTDVINVNSTGGTRRSGSSGSTAMPIMVAKTITAVPVASEISEMMGWSV